MAIKLQPLLQLKPDRYSIAPLIKHAIGQGFTDYIPSKVYAKGGVILRFLPNRNRFAFLRAKADGTTGPFNMDKWEEVTDGYIPGLNTASAPKAFVKTYNSTAEVLAALTGNGYTEVPKDDPTVIVI